MLMKLETPFLRKPDPPPAFASGRYSRGIFLSRLRGEIAILTVIGLDHAAIAHALGTTDDDVRVLRPTTRRKVMRSDLTRHAVNALLHGRYARLGGRTVGNRAKHLVEIASAYTRDELLMEPGIGAATVTEIQLWLEKKGRVLR